MIYYVRLQSGYTGAYALDEPFRFVEKHYIIGGLLKYEYSYW